MQPDSYGLIQELNKDIRNAAHAKKKQESTKDSGEIKPISPKTRKKAKKRKLLGLKRLSTKLKITRTGAVKHGRRAKKKR